MLYYTTTRVSLIPRLSRTLRSEESRYAPRHDTLGGLSKQEWGEIAENFKVMDMTYEISNRNARFEKSQARTEALATNMEALFARMEARQEANLQNAMQKLAFDVADGTKLQRESYQKLSVGLDALQLGMDQNTTTINALRVQDFQDKMDSKLPELEIKQDNLRKETAQCFQELCDRNQADMWSLEKNVALKIEAELDAAFKHIDQQINRVSGELRQEMKVKDDEFEARVNQGFSDLEHQMDKQCKVKEVDQLTSETEANKKQKHNCDSESEKEADDIVKINKIKRGRRIKESDDPLFFQEKSNH